MQVGDTWKRQNLTVRVDCGAPPHFEDKQVEQVQLYTIIKKSGVVENGKLPAAFQKVGHRTIKEHHAPVPAGSQQTCHGFLPALDKEQR